MIIKFDYCNAYLCSATSSLETPGMRRDPSLNAHSQTCVTVTVGGGTVGGQPDVVALLAARARAGAGGLPRVPSVFPRRNRPPPTRSPVSHNRGRLHPRGYRQHRRSCRRAAGGRSADAAAKVRVRVSRVKSRQTDGSGWSDSDLVTVNA
jgi:hypothetical protein